MPTYAENLEALITDVPIPFFIADGEDRYLFINQPAREFLDYQDGNIVGEKILDVFYSENEIPESDTAENWSEERDERYELEFVRRDGTTTWGEVFSRKLAGNRRMVFICDITERKRAEQKFILSEERLWQTQKYDALGKLAGGVAHDFNNFLAVIMLHSDMLCLQLPGDSPHLRRVNEIKSVVNNAAEIVRQLLAFGRKQEMSPDFVNLNETVNEFSKKLPALIGDQIKTHLDLNPLLSLCLVDAKQIQKVLTNLIINATEAMPDGGLIEIKTTNLSLDKNTVRHKAQPHGSYVELSVADTGTGMNAEVKEHLFEPFFSTKQSDKSAGLGLAIVYGIVKQLKGFIWVESEINQGTTVRIQFPVVERRTVVGAPQS